MTKVLSNSTTSAVQVAVRIRPLTDRDRTQPRFANLNDDDCLKTIDNTIRVVPQNKLFTYDHVFGPNSQQDEIFETVASKLVLKFVEGYNVTILAYGQTSSGKTYTMGTMQQDGQCVESQVGIVPRAMSYLFQVLQQPSSHLSAPPPPASHQRPASPTSSVSSSTTSRTSRLRPRSRMSMVPTPTPSRSSRYSQAQQKYSVKVSFIEIYNEELKDLLNDAPVDERPLVSIREDAKGQIYWTGVKEVPVNNADDVLFYLQQGTKTRATGATDMNEQSSRSHAIFSVTLQQEKPANGSDAASTRRASSRHGEDADTVLTTSKFHFVDLAGSERLKRTDAKGNRRKEGININAGLLALGNVISALADASKKSLHIPYRDSKLTRLLQDSLGGNAATLMIACVSPMEYNLSETLNTMQYANRARSIKNRLEKNEFEEWMTTENIELLRTLVGKLKQQVKLLKSSPMIEVEHGESVNGTVNGGGTYDEDLPPALDSNEDMDQILQEYRLAVADLQHQIEELDGETTVTRERNRVVEAELVRMRRLDDLRQRKQSSVDMDFEHLVEPVIEEYEKSIANLETDLALAKQVCKRASADATTHQRRFEELQQAADRHTELLLEWKGRYNILSERDQSNNAYIEELEAKLANTAQDASRHTNTINDLQSTLLKQKDNDSSNEQYIRDLEKRLAHSEESRTTLEGNMASLEQKQSDQDILIFKLRQQAQKKASGLDAADHRMMLEELDNLNGKCALLEKEKQEWMLKAHDWESAAAFAKNHRDSSSLSIDASLAALEGTTVDPAHDHPHRHRQSLAEEKRRTLSSMDPSSPLSPSSSSSSTALAAATAHIQQLEETIASLEKKNGIAVDELGSMLRRYQDAQDQIEQLQQESLLAMPVSTPHALTLATQQASTPASISQESDRAMLSASLAEHGQGGLEQGFLLHQEMGRANDQHMRDSIQELQNRLAEQLEAHESHLHALKATIQQLETDVEEATNRSRMLQQQVDDHDDTMERTILQLDDALTAKDKLDDTLAQLERDHADLLQEKNTLADDLDRWQKDKAPHDSPDASEHQLQEAHAYIKALENAADEHALQIKELLQQLDDADAQLKQVADAHNCNLEHLTNTHDQAEARWKEKLATDMASLAADHERQLAKLAQDHAEQLETQAGELECKLENEWQDRFDSLNNQYQQDIEQLTDQRAAANGDLEAMWAERLTASAESHQQEIQRLLDMQSQLTDQLTKQHEAQLDELAAKTTHDLDAAWTARLSTSEQTHESNIAALTDAHQLAMADLKTEHQQVLDLLTQKHSLLLADHATRTASALDDRDVAHEKLISDLKAAHQRDGADLKDEHQKALGLLTTQHNTSVAEHKTSITNELGAIHAMKIAELNDTHQRAVNDLKNEHQQNVNVLVQKHDTLMAEHTAATANAVKEQEAAHEKSTNELKHTHQQVLDLLAQEHSASLVEHEKMAVNAAKEQDAAHEMKINELKHGHQQALDHLTQQHDASLTACTTAAVNAAKEQNAAHEATLNELARAHQASVADLKTEQQNLQEAHQRAIVDLKDEHQQAMRLLIQQHDASLAEHTASAANASNATQVLDAAWAERLANRDEAHEKSIGGLKELHQCAMTELKDKHQQALDILVKSHEDSLTEHTANATNTVKDLESTHQQSIDQLTGDHQLVLTDLDKEHQHAVADLKKEHKQAMDRLTEEHHGQLADQIAKAANDLDAQWTDRLASKDHAHQQHIDQLDKDHQRALSDLRSSHENTLDDLDVHHRELLTATKHGLSEQMEAMEKNYQRDLNQANATMKGELDDAYRDMAELEDLLQETENKLAEANALMEEAVNERTDLEKVLEEAVQENEQAMAKLSKLENEFKVSAEEKSSLLATITELQKSHARTEPKETQGVQGVNGNQVPSAKVQEHDATELPMKPDNVGIVEQEGKVTEDTAYQKELVDRLKNENQEFTDLMAILEKELNKATQDVDRMVIEIEDKDNTIEAQTANLATLTSTLAMTKDQLTEMEQQLHALENRDLGQGKADDTSAEQLDQMTRQNQQLQQDLQSETREKEKLQRQAKILEDKLDLLLQSKKKFLCF
ncbi:kinesin-domain-containing protein [Hesseltinella vesiculosa]|uniref:Kinesin-domain-containing protein n=1 Tax=Hesseltinella vesiculosa TaxID=101127 RepID=A0A1X2GQ39_9FUNG|nr:kinesin-domain-containing protein [Hesseltinella vesiculosa]